MSAIQTIGPVTVGGWYKNTNGSYTEYRWVDGQPKALRTVATEADIAAIEQDELAAFEQPYRAVRS